MNNCAEKITPRWIKLVPAVKYSSIGKDRLKALAKKPDSIIIGFPDPDSKRKDWIFDRESLDKYRINQDPKNIVKQKLLAFRNKNGL